MNLHVPFLDEKQIWGLAVLVFAILFGFVLMAVEYDWRRFWANRARRRFQRRRRSVYDVQRERRTLVDEMREYSSERKERDDRVDAVRYSMRSLQK